MLAVGSQLLRKLPQKRVFGRIVEFELSDALDPVFDEDAAEGSLLAMQSALPFGLAPQKLALEDFAAID